MNAARALGKTPWVDRSLRGAWARIAARVPPSWLPVQLSQKPFHVEEFACGHYGCVMPTSEAGVVCKLTSDPSEARFVAMLQSMRQPDEGIVRYLGLFALAGATYRGRQLYVLWRSEAYDVGILANSNLLGYPRNSQADAIVRAGFDKWQYPAIYDGTKLLLKFRDAAKIAREVLVPRLAGPKRDAVLAEVWRDYEQLSPGTDGIPSYAKGIRRAAYALRYCLNLSQEIANTDVVYHVGAALGDFLAQGVLLADVHLNNIGRDALHNLTITDPGHAVEFSPRWAKLPLIEAI